MKKQSILLALFLLLVVLPLALTQNGCTSSPASPAAPTPTPTTVVTFNWAGGGTYVYNTNGTPYYQAYARIRANGVTITTAAVTLTDGTTSWPMAYTTYTILSGPVTYSEYDTTTFANYTPGKTYKITATVLGQSSAVSGVAPGGQTLYIDASNSAVTETTWTNSGTNDEVYVREFSPTAQFPYSASGGLVSPLTTFGGAYPDTGTGASYAVHMINDTHATAIANGTFDGGTYYDLYEESSQGVTFP